MKLGILSVFAAVTTLALVTSFCGCSGENELAGIYSDNIRKVHQCYLMYMEEHGYRGPKDEEELKTYLKTDPTAIFLTKRIDLTPEGVDDIFISERDGEPFVIRYGLNGIADHAIVFEAVGVDGTRLIALTPPLEVEDEDEYDDYLTGKIKPETEADVGEGQTPEE